MELTNKLQILLKNFVPRTLSLKLSSGDPANCM